MGTQGRHQKPGSPSPRARGTTSIRSSGRHASSLALSLPPPRSFGSYRWLAVGLFLTDGWRNESVARRRTFPDRRVAKRTRTRREATGRPRCRHPCPPKRIEKQRATCFAKTSHPRATAIRQLLCPRPSPPGTPTPATGRQPPTCTARRLPRPASCPDCPYGHPSVPSLFESEGTA